MNFKKIALITLILLSLLVISVFCLIPKREALLSGHSAESISVPKDTIAHKVSSRIDNTDRFGLNSNGIRITSGTIKKRQNLGALLRTYGLSSQTIYKIVQQAKGIFNVRSIRSGHSYHFYLEQDSNQVAKYFVYEENPVDYVVFALTSPFHVNIGHRKIKTLTATASGLIESSLYETLNENHIDPALAEELSDVFAWQIDFYHLQKGDQFKILYTKEIVDGHYIGNGVIKAAYFKQAGRAYYAFRFSQGEKIDYFDLNGQSLRKAFLKVPLKYSYISSRFSYHRYHPVLHRYMPHLGVDFAAPPGTPVHAVGDGVIEVARYNHYDGNYIKIRHNSEYQTEYLHLSHFARGIRHGKAVKQGQLIGYVGSTGLATGPHLDYRIWKNGREVNPLKIDLPSSDPIQNQYKQAYYEHLGLLLSQLNNISIHQNIKNHIAVEIDTVRKQDNNSMMNNISM